ncbi:MAG TPA: glycosyltransferase [Pseudonocardiaceae bacterium]|jgi:glycosyltransferase involved in cell wall biosynthesis
MIALGIALSCIAACCYGLAASLQNGAVQAVSAATPAGPRDGLSWRQLRRVVVDRKWLYGMLATSGGALFHVLALSMAPLVVVQPIGVLAIGVTVLLAVAGGRERLTSSTVFASLASIVGVGLFVTLAAGKAGQGVQQPGVELRIAVVTAGIVFVLGWIGLRAKGWLRAPALAAAAGVCFGLVSVLARVISEHLRSADVSGIGIGWVVGIPIAVGLGAWFVQQAHAAGRPDTVVACQSVVDPLMGVLVGAICFGEAGQVGPIVIIGELACAVLAVIGIVALAMRKPFPSNTNHVMTREFQVASTSGYRTQMRLVIGADTFPPDVNGAARFAHQLAAGFAGRGHDVHVICPSDTGTEGTEQLDGITVHRLRSHGTPYHPTFRICLPWQVKAATAALLDEIKPDLVHVQAHFVVGRALVRNATAREIPVIATNHFMPENLFDYVKVPHWFRQLVARLAWGDLARVFGAARVVTAPTPTAAQMLVSKAGLTGAVARSCGVDLDRFATSTTSPATAPTVLFVGRLDAEKHVHELLRAIALLPKSIKAEIVGDGSCRADLQSLAGHLGIADRVRFLGFVSDEELCSSYTRCSVFCMPGVAELQSLATMEAMAAGKPVVAANAVALPHLVRPGDNGWLFEPGDIAGLANALAAVLDTPETVARLGEGSRRIIAAHDLGASLDAFDAIYRNALGQARPEPVVRLRAVA